MDAPVFNMSGEEVGRQELPDEVFGIEPNRAVMHQALVRQLANARRGTHKTQTRSEVDRTRRKWYRQKGTGRARHGDRAAPTFVGGGVAHGPRSRTYKQAMPKKMRRLALRSALSAKAADRSIVVIDALEMAAPKTRAMEDLIDRVCEGETTLVLLGGQNEAVERSVRNLPHVRHLRVSYLNVRDVLGYERIMIDRPTVEQVVRLLGTGGARDPEVTNASD